MKLLVKLTYLRGSELLGVIELDFSFSISACSVSDGSSVSSPVPFDSTLSTVEDRVRFVRRDG